MQTIYDQTYQNIEIIVSDNYSEDGAWEFFQQQQGKDGRIRLSQAAKNGLYQNWNNCIEKAGGEYVYIATSDDTMTPTCLATMVEALERNSACDICHCCLTFIDQVGQPISEGHCWHNHATTRYFGDWNRRRHIRPPGHDAVVALALKTTYYSITQVLIRRKLFEVVGMFRKDWGSFGDLEWQMRASLMTSTFHVPEYLATWRLHPGQASQMDRYRQAVLDGWFLDMADGVIRFSKEHGVPIRSGLPSRLRKFYWTEHIRAHLQRLSDQFSRLGFLLSKFPSSPRHVVAHLLGVCARRIRRGEVPLESQVRKELNRLKIPGPRPVE